MTQNSSNQDYQNNADGAQLGGGVTKRILKWLGANITITGSGTNTYTMPSSTDTLVGRASTDTLTNKTINASNNTITNVSNLSVARQDNTTNSTVGGSRIETGWGVVAVTTSSGSYNETVTFNSAFTAPPIVIITYGGDNITGGSAYGNGGNVIEANIIVKAVDVTTSNFGAWLRKPSGSFVVNGYAYYQWMAIGA